MDTRFVSGVLLRCFIYGFALTLIWFGLFVTIGDWVFGHHSRWFEITRHDFDLMNYFGMAALKVFVLAVFGVPYLAIRFGPKATRPSD